ncbi:MAG: cation-translocating P-type ATPase [Candidatus Freyarchaeota archaeon]
MVFLVRKYYNSLGLLFLNGTFRVVKRRATEIIEIKNWHSKPVEEVMRLLETSPRGLTGEEARRRLKVYGPNRIEEIKRLSPARLFLRQFQNALNYILILAAVISVVGGSIIDAVVIVAILFLNATLGFLQEYRSERALEALKELSAPKTLVIRDGVERRISSEELVPGDLVVLTTGDKVPADIRLYTSVRMRVEESILTGEPGSEEKFVEAMPEDTPMVERLNTGYSGTSVTSGRGSGFVVATGMNTEVGKIAQEISEASEEKTPLQKRISSLAVYLAVLALIMASSQASLALLRGIPVLEVLLLALASAISSIPEGLPAVITIVLVVGVRRMAKRNAIVRKLQAVETLGSATVICSDKTGTLTKNEMTVCTLYLNGETIDVTGEGYAPAGDFRRNGALVNPEEHPHLKLILRAMALCNDARLVVEDGRYSVYGDPTEVALVVAAAKGGVNKDEEEAATPRIDEIPFESELACMATVHDFTEEEKFVYAKGSPERMISLCSEIYINGGPVPVTEEHRRMVLDASHELAARGCRVLGVSYRAVGGLEYCLAREECGRDLVFLGLVGMMDPPKREAIEAVGKCKKAGIRVVMITGDHPETARAIARQVGIIGEDGEVIEGSELDEISDEELEETVERVDVFARTEPRHKLRIVRALKNGGDVVAMIGDGVNDAPALKEANIGVAMGITGTQIAKETSDMVLADDNFSSIVGAVEEGRTAFSNLRKVVTYLLTTNIAEDIILLTTLLLGLPLPFLPLQILWINLVTDGVCDKTLAVEPRSRDVLKDPPRPPGERIVSRSVVYHIVFLASIMAVGTVLVYLLTVQLMGLYVLFRGYDEPRTVTFYTAVFFQLFNALNARSRESSLFRIGLLSNRYLVLGLVFSFVLNIFIVYVPFFQQLFGIVPLPLHDWFLVLFVSSSVFIVEEIRKAVAPKLFG